MNIKVQLKDMDSINLLLESGDDVTPNEKHTEGILYELDCSKDYTLVKMIEYGGNSVAFESKTGYFIHPSWIKEFTLGRTPYEPITGTPRKGSRYLNLVGDKYFDFHISEVIKGSDIKVCVECGAEDIVDEGLCSKCFNNKYWNKHNYSYRPDIKFYGEQVRKDTDNPIWYGLELEYGLKTKTEMSRLLKKYKGEVIIKDDVSIRGTEKAELVSQPMSFTRLMGKDSFLKDIPSLDSEGDNTENGCHVHMSRTAFKDNRHYGLFYFLLYKDVPFVEYIGNRSLTTYCKCKPSGKVNTKDNTSLESDRSVMLNENNKATVEARFFLGTNDEAKVKVYVQFLDSLIKYTKYHKHTVTLAKWFRYVTKYKTKYPELFKKVSDYSGTLEGTITYNVPKEYKIAIEELLMMDTSGITEIKTGGDVLKVKNCYIEGSYIRYTLAEEGYGAKVHIDYVQSLTLIK